MTITASALGTSQDEVAPPPRQHCWARGSRPREKEAGVSQTMMESRYWILSYFGKGEPAERAQGTRTRGEITSGRGEDVQRASKH